VTPVPPASTGGGLAMRAGLFLDGLSRAFRVRTLVVPVLEPDAELPDAAVGGRYDAVHVLRLYLAPFAQQVLASLDGPRPFCSIDVDDDDATVFAQLGLADEAAELDRLARDVLPSFDLVVTASIDDPARLAERYGLSHVVAIPNAVAPPPRQQTKKSPGPTVLYVGDLGYRPNVDAALRLCNEILPALRAQAPAANALVVGNRPPPELRALPGVTGYVESVTPSYAAADVAAIPLTAGGGSRTKIVEAFAHRVPVVATAVAASGLGLPGDVLVTAETNDEFVAAILRLRDDEAFRTELVDAAEKTYRQRFTLDAVAETIAAHWTVTDLPTRRDGLEVNDVADGCVVYDAASDRVHYLNGTAAIVFELCTGDISVDEMAAFLQRTFELDAPPREETDACLARLREEGLLR
jgi:glycosyltransferase involved in cell wall biosynthesis